MRRPVATDVPTSCFCERFITLNWLVRLTTLMSVVNNPRP